VPQRAAFAVTSRRLSALIGAFERHPAGNFNAGLCETVELGRIVVSSTVRVQLASGACLRRCRIALIVIEGECGVGVEVSRPSSCNRYVRILLRDQAAALPSQIEKIPPPRSRAAPEEPKLFPAVAAPWNLTVASQAGGMQPHGNSILVKSRVPTMTATGLHLSMDARHEPAELVLHKDKRHNQPVKCFRGGSQSGLFGHGMPKFVYLAWDSTRTNSNAIATVAAR